MPIIQIHPVNLADIDRPTCDGCGSRMWLSRVSSPVEGRELHTFECPVCEVSIGNDGTSGRGSGSGSGASTPL